MKRQLEPSLIATFWPHAVLQMFAFVVYMLALEPSGFFPAVQLRLGELEARVGWGLPFFLWLVFIFLLTELLTRISQRIAASVFPDMRSGFVGLSFFLAVPALYAAFVVLECVLSFVALGRYPVHSRPEFFFDGVWQTMLNDWLILAVIAIGEFLRHVFYAGSLQRWHQERVMPLQEEEA